MPVSDVVVQGYKSEEEPNLPLGQTGLYSSKDGSKHPGAAFYVCLVLNPGFEPLKEPLLVTRFMAIEGDVEQIKKQLGYFIDSLYEAPLNWEKSAYERGQVGDISLKAN